MEKIISEIKNAIYSVLANAPAENECTPEANEMLRDMQRLRESIEFFEAKGAKVYDENYTADDYAAIEEPEEIQPESDRLEYDTLQFARIRTVELRVILENNVLPKTHASVLIEEHNLLAQFLRNHGEEIDDLEEC